MADEQTSQIRKSGQMATPAKVQLDGKEYDLVDLSREAQLAVQFMQRIDGELSNLRYELDKCARARNQALSDLRAEIRRKDEGSVSTDESQPGIDVSGIVQ